MAEKLVICIWNYKGGVGKSTISLALAEIAAQKKLNVCVIDLDGQRNLSDALGFVGDIFPNISVQTKIPDELTADLCILDTRPEMSPNIRSAISFSDMVLVPVLGDFFSAANIGAVWQHTSEMGLHLAQTAMIENCFDNTATAREIDTALQQKGFSFAGRLPRNMNLVRNIAGGRPWNFSMDSRQQIPFLQLYFRIWKAYEKMCAGDFDSAWK